MQTTEDNIFSNSVFYAARGRKRVRLQQMSKSKAAALEQTLHICHKCGSKNILSIAKQVRAYDEDTSVVNKCNDCHNKWRDG